MPKRRQGVWKDSEEEDEEYKAASAGSSESDGESERSFEKEVEQEEKRAEQEKRRRQVEQKRQQKAEQQKSEEQASSRRTRHRKKINYNEDALMRDLDEEIDEEEEEVDGGVRKRRKVGGGMPGSGSEAAEDEKVGNSSGEKRAVKNSSDSDFVPDMEEHEEPADADFVVSDSDSVTGGRRRRRRSRKPQFVVKDDEETEEDGEFDPDSSLVGHRGRPRGSRGLRRRGRPRIHREEEEDEGEKSEKSENSEKDEPKTLEEELQSLKEENEENGLPNGEGEGEGEGTLVHRHLRRRKQVNYTLPPPVLTDAQIEQMDAAARGALAHDSPRRRAGRYGGGSMYGSFHSAQGVRRLFPTAGPFGGSEVHALYGQAQAPASESEDSDATAPIPAAPNAAPSAGAVGAVGASPSSSSSDSEVEALVAEADRRLGSSRAGADRTGANHTGAWRTTVQEGSAAPRRGRKSTLADTDPLGGCASIDFSCVGGLDRYISQLKEMITLPLLYPELYSRFQISPPRGVLFHGPPGTGKTLMARALASSCSAEGRKITFFMRKGSDCLSKWVGEAERNLRLLFQEAEKKQPSIIFFDEIDGLAPVRSSKQEQIHASIVSTLLALMDGIDNRGQVVVIGATNRPDAVDPALRRPGRFDREFYFPLPDLDSRAQIIRIHTKGWAHAPDAAFTRLLARMTRGYGGADLKALCAESALNAIQRTYPQIYGSRRRLVVDASQVRVSAADFARALRRIVPSSARPSGGAATGGIVGTGGGEAGTLRAAGADSAGSADSEDGADGTDAADRALVALGQPPSAILLADQISALRALVQRLVPCAKQLSALEEARYVDFGARMPDGGFQMQQAVRQLDQARVFRPRIVVCGLPGQAQRQVCENVLSALEGLVVQKLDFARLYSDASIVPETAAVRVFQELRAHEPAVLFVPDVLGFLDGCAVSVRSTIGSMVRALPARAKVLILATIEDRAQYAASRRSYDEQLRLVFGIESVSAGTSASATASAVSLRMADPAFGARRQFFRRVWNALRLSPVDYNDVAIRPKRVLAQLPVAAGADADGAGGAESAAAQAKREARRSARRRKLRARSDLRLKNTLKVRLSRLMDTFKTRYKRFRRPVVDDAYLVHLFEQVPDPAAAYQKSGDMIVEVATGKKFYNMDLEVIEERLWNGFYSEPRQFLRDLDLIVRDAKELGERDRIWKANEMYANAEVGVEDMEMAQPKLAKEWKELYRRERRRAQASGDVNANATAQHQDADVQHHDDAAHAAHAGTLNGGDVAGDIVTSVVSSSGPQMQAQAQLRTGVPLKQHGELEDAEMRQDDRDMRQVELPGNSRKNGSEIVGEGDRPKDGGLKEIDQKKEIYQKEILQKETSQKEILQKETSQKETAQKEIIQKDTPQKEENSQPNNYLNIQNIPDTVSLDSDKVEHLQNELLSKTEGARAESLESIFSRLIQIVWDNRLETDKSHAISQMDALIGSL